MKIYRIAAAQQFQFMQQSPNAPVDPAVQQQNIQQAQQAVQVVDQAIAIFGQLEANMAKIEDLFGVKIADQVRQAVRQAVTNTSIYKFLSQFGKIASVDELLDVTKFNEVKVKVQKDIQNLQSGIAAPTTQPQTKSQ